MKLATAYPSDIWPHKWNSAPNPNRVFGSFKDPSGYRV
eukprot:CAMPEP_0184319582 /NCGR_PEP_ID=MMETSP1049-20130417/109391_1 /TAXON_ID=77928 /ORGANISM="Proteomonas sulcata, Strain CCMP704" /LENGTH=37 /DNA_ID= /DNA_START= /DNA_END= /DNA_ORIENTATION=